MNEYKGLYYGDDENDEPKFFEHGAHFRYNELYNILENLLKKLPNNRRGFSEDNINSNYKTKNQNSNKKEKKFVNNNIIHNIMSRNKNIENDNNNNNNNSNNTFVKIENKT